MDSEHWEILEDDFMEEEIDSSSDNLVEFHGFDTNESYDLMADFAEHVEDEKLKQELQEALNRKKPFRNFKKCLESSSGAFRDEWFSYIQYRHELLVREQIERLMAEDTAGIGER